MLSRPCNLLVLDEPTNDLDLETLELLEDLLLEFQGTLLVVSHDRAFLDNVVSSTLVCEGDGRWAEYVGGYSDWLRQAAAAKPSPAAAAPRRPRAQARSERAAARPRRLGLQGKARARGAARARSSGSRPRSTTLFARMSSPTWYQTSAEEMARTRERLDALEAALREAYARWAELDSLAAAE